MSVSLSTHVLDAASGQPAAGVAVAVYRGQLRVAGGVTDGEGRVHGLAEGLVPGVYRLVFEVGAYFGGSDHLWERVALEVRLHQPRHYHLPLLLSPFSCMTYRGS